MAKCGNCGAKLGCSCKLRKAKDGKSCCVSCVTAYNNKLKFANKPLSKVQAANQPGQPETAPSVILSATAVQKE